MQITQAKRLVIKVGSSLVTDDSGKLRAAWMDSLATDIANLRRAGSEVIIVTSGAVALGRSTLGIAAKNLKLEEKQAAAACGQPLLMDAWRLALAKHDIPSAQLLLTIDETENRRRYLNARNTLDTLLEQRVLPIINENDTVATAELRFGDNDRLAARVAQMAAADTLILLSDVDGLYSANPSKTSGAQFIPEVRLVTPEIEQMASGPSSTMGSGGMTTKIAAAKIALAAGCSMVITLGKELNPIQRLLEGARCTWFLASATPMNARKHWIGGSISATGSVVVDAGAAAALAGGKSLLPAGVKRVEGEFDRGDTVLIKDEKGKVLGKGLIAYSHIYAAKIIGHKSQEIEQILGFKGRDTLIHRDDMVLE